MEDVDFKMVFGLSLMLTLLIYPWYYEKRFSEKSDKTNSSHMVKNEIHHVQKEKTLSKDFEDAPENIRNAKGLSVYKQDGELSRAIEPNHKISGFNGIRLD
jgi:hypothetical protein